VRLKRAFLLQGQRLAPVISQEKPGLVARHDALSLSI
jgi:hypothetical protein